MGKYRMSHDGTTLIEEKPEIPVARSYDVIVAGGGSAGTAAAVAAGRMGAKTLLIDRNEYLGGTSTGALMPHFGAPSDSLSGYMKEVVDELLTLGAAQAGAFVPFDAEVLKQVHLRNVLKAGVDLLLYTWIVDAIVEGDQLRGVVVQNKSGRQAILAQTVVDATGDGDVAAFAGAEFQKGRADGAMRPVTIIFRMGNVDMEKLVDYMARQPDQFMSDQTMSFVNVPEGKLRLAGFYELVKAAREKGELDRECHYLRVESGDFEKRLVMINTVRVYGIDGTNAWDLTRGVIETRKQMDQLIPFLKRDVPGFEKAFLIDSAAMLGVRETRHIIGEYILTYDDILSGRQFDDVVVYSCAYLPRKEMHSPDAREGAEEDAANRGESWPRICHEIPFRSLVVKGVKNLLVAGRCMSATHEADRNTRNIPPCVMTGQAAGAAAALASKDRIAPSDLNIRRLQAALLKQGVDFGRPVAGLEVNRAARS
jgi:hypothetical protein